MGQIQRQPAVILQAVQVRTLQVDQLAVLAESPERVLERMERVRVLAVEAGKTLLFEREQLTAEADQAGIAVIGMKD